MIILNAANVNKVHTFTILNVLPIANTRPFLEEDYIS